MKVPEKDELTYKIKKVQGDWQAVAYINGRRDEDKTYYGMDKEDCEQTAQAELTRYYEMKG